MNYYLLVISILLILGIGIILYVLVFKKGGQKKDGDQSFLMLQNQINEIVKMMDSRLGESTKFMQNQFGESNKIVREFTEKITKLDETNKRVVSFTDQVQNLERVLTSSKNRGTLGEVSLEFILSSILPPQTYEMQYRFKNGEAVDAAIKIKNKILSVDAKFSLDNYRRILSEENEDKKRELEKEFRKDLKKRIDETAKYIRPNEDTLDFAFMFIPAEGIYYDLLINEIGAVKVDTSGLIDYAFKEKRVIIVSPTTFAAYLETVLQGLNAMEIEEKIQPIIKKIEELKRHLASYETYLKKMGNNLKTTVNMYDSAYKEFGKIDKDFLKITGKSNEIDPMIIDGPKNDEEI